MPYNYTIRYMPGKQNIADALSRLIGKTGNSGKEENIEEEYIRFVPKQATPKSLTTREIEEFSRYDEEISEIRVSLDQAKWNRTLTNYYPMRTEFSKLGYLILRGTRILIPKPLRLQCISLAHEGDKANVEK